jgi:hypothetical protein
MEILLLMSVTGLVGLAVSAGMLYATQRPYFEQKNDFDHQGRDDFFQRLKANAARLK